MAYGLQTARMTSGGQGNAAGSNGLIVKSNGAPPFGAMSTGAEVPFDEAKLVALKIGRYSPTASATSEISIAVTSADPPSMRNAAP